MILRSGQCTFVIMMMVVWCHFLCLLLLCLCINPVFGQNETQFLNKTVTIAANSTTALTSFFQVGESEGDLLLVSGLTTIEISGWNQPQALMMCLTSTMAPQANFQYWTDCYNLSVITNSSFLVSLALFNGPWAIALAPTEMLTAEVDVAITISGVVCNSSMGGKFCNQTIDTLDGSTIVTIMQQETYSTMIQVPALVTNMTITLAQMHPDNLSFAYELVYMNAWSAQRGQIVTDGYEEINYGLPAAGSYILRIWHNFEGNQTILGNSSQAEISMNISVAWSSCPEPTNSTTLVIGLFCSESALPLSPQPESGTSGLYTLNSQGLAYFYYDNTNDPDLQVTIASYNYSSAFQVQVAVGNIPTSTNTIYTTLILVNSTAIPITLRTAQGGYQAISQYYIAIVGPPRRQFYLWQNELCYPTCEKNGHQCINATNNPNNGLCLCANGVAQVTCPAKSSQNFPDTVQHWIFQHLVIIILVTAAIVVLLIVGAGLRLGFQTYQRNRADPGVAVYTRVN